jgi:3-isopropylmalate/(R)-2-methylmalate dehydratase large subunit
VKIKKGFFRRELKMGKTIAEKIFSKHSKKDVKAGDYTLAKLDMVLVNDITGPLSVMEFQKLGNISVFDKDKIAIICDHFTPNKDIKSAQNVKMLRNFAKEQNIKHFYEPGNVGIEHVMIPELGLARPGYLIIGADSHTCTYGALNAFSTGVGSTDAGMAMATGDTWFRVPPSFKVEIVGKQKKWIGGKDVILHLIGKIGVEGANYFALEFCGEGIENLSIDDRFTISNMAIECGGKAGIFNYDKITENYFKELNIEIPDYIEADKNANYEKSTLIDLSKLDYTVSLPFSPDNTTSINKLEKTFVDQVVIGSCTNGRISDLRIAAEILTNKKVKDGLRVIILPGSPKVYLEALREGLIEKFILAGAAVSTPTCGPCLGGHMGILAEDEVCVSTTNRNFIGRMGHPKSKVILASPAVAAASAVTGYITSPEEVM